jgi:carboxylesterase type B
MPSAYPTTLETPGNVTACLQPVVPSCRSSAIGSPLLAIPTGTSVEDCLFLDLYAPVSAVSNKTANLAVIVWIYGGAFIIGSKEAAEPNFPLYNGTGLIQAAQSMNEGVIFVAGNYRLDPLGWLAGTAMNAATKGNTATTKAGLTDQFLLFQ